MSRAERIEEAARALCANAGAVIDKPKWIVLLREHYAALDAALALPADDGDVVDRADAHAAALRRRAFHSAIEPALHTYRDAVISASKQSGLASYNAWAKQAHEAKMGVGDSALSAAGLLARPMPNRERLARALATWQNNGNNYWDTFHEGIRAQYLDRADAILREMGR